MTESEPAVSPPPQRAPPPLDPERPRAASHLPKLAEPSKARIKREAEHARQEGNLRKAALLHRRRSSDSIMVSTPPPAQAKGDPSPPKATPKPPTSPQNKPSRTTPEMESGAANHQNQQHHKPLSASSSASASASASPPSVTPVQRRPSQPERPQSAQQSGKQTQQTPAATSASATTPQQQQQQTAAAVASVNGAHLHRRETSAILLEEEDALRTRRTMIDAPSPSPTPPSPSAQHQQRRGSKPPQPNGQQQQPQQPQQHQQQTNAGTSPTPMQEFRKMSTEAKSEEMKRRLSGYYGQLQSRVIAHIFWFDVLIGRDNRKRLLQVNLATGLITRFTKLRKKKKEWWPFSAILQAIRSDTDPELITLRLRDGTSTSFHLLNQVERERFYGLCWLGQVGLLATGGSVLPSTEDINIFVGTWNMADEAPKQPPELWLRPNAYDICVVCAQECTSDGLFHKLTGHLEASYIKLEFASILYVKLAVFVHRQHVAKIRFVEKSTEATGFGNFVGNKGAVAIAFQFNDTSLCFIGCHLAANEGKAAERNKQYQAIVKGLKLGQPRCDVLNQFDHVVWCGDFNYRIPRDFAHVNGRIAVSDYASLLAEDELNVLRASDQVFVDHVEGPIRFAPTYKLTEGCHGYDSRRTPAWCDRVMWRSLPHAYPLRQIEYDSSEILTSSDHRPVHSVFHATVQLPADPCRIVPLSILFRGTVSASGLLYDPPVAGAEPDVALIFKAPFLDPRRTYHSRVKKATRNPDWAHGEIKEIVTCVCDPAYIAHQHLSVLVIHIDASSQVVLGQCTIPLADMSPEGAAFTSRITREGKPAGYLKGTVCTVPSS